MKLFSLFLTLALVTLAQASDQGTAKPSADRELTAKIIQCEKGTWEAFKAQDGEAYRALCCPEFYEISSSGELHYLKDILQSMQTLDTTFYRMEDCVVTQVAQDTCLLRYTITVQYAEGGRPEPLHKALASAVWIRRNGVWLSALYQETLISP